MSTIGYEVCMLSTGANNPRNGEGTFIRLKDGGILYAYTMFVGNGWCDHDRADIAGILSYDEGESWTEPHILIAQDDESANLMCPCFVRMNNGDIGLIYLRKYMEDAENQSGHYGGDPVLDNVLFVRSVDEGKTWSAPIDVTTAREFIGIENDHAVMLQNGRIVIPANQHTTTENGKRNVSYHAKMFFIASDDDGLTWKIISDEYDIPHPQNSTTGLQETVIYQQNDGRIRALSRTDRKCQYETWSEDNCETWSEIYPNVFFTSPESPLNMKRACGYTVAVWNPTPNYTGRVSACWGRTPLALAVSENDGASFDRLYYLEDDPNNGYCYPSIFDGGDYLLVGYYHSAGTGMPLNANKIVKVLKSELQA
ncbi:MAG: exo-alpha-sialidase [Clostridia bacterium]|nr:exo-alpha-sialidase [Clostridia bacterium]